jgi:hypothetical protein
VGGVTSEKCVLREKMVLPKLHSDIKKRDQLRSKKTLADYFNGMFLNTGHHFS